MVVLLQAFPKGLLSSWITSLTCFNSTEEYCRCYMYELMERCWVCAANIPKGSVPKLVRYFVLRRNTLGAGVEIIQK